MRALVVGGTGQIGPLVVRGLLERGHRVTVLHGGQHEHPELPEVEHIHADAHFADSLQSALGARRFDLVVAMYGRSRVLAEVLPAYTGRLVAVTGAIYAFNEPRDPRWGPFGVTAATEDSPFSDDSEQNRLSASVREGERALLAGHARGDFSVTILRLPNVYGPDSRVGTDWTVVRRILDRRPHFLIPDGGLCVRSRIYRDNAAHALLLAVDRPDAAGGQVFHVADDAPMLTVGQTVDCLARALGHDWQLVDVPHPVLERLYRSFYGYHRVLDTTKIRTRLGYRDLVSAAEGLARTARWWAEHPPERGGAFEQRMADKFDYLAEDAVVAACRRSREAVMRDLGELPARFHPYRHPKSAGDGWDAATAERVMNRPANPRPYALWNPGADAPEKSA